MSSTRYVRVLLLIAVIALSTVMIVAPGTAPTGPGGAVDSNAIFASGIAGVMVTWDGLKAAGSSGLLMRS